MNQISKKALIFCWIVLTLVAFMFYPKWNKSQTEATLSWDASGYYMYLPALFIYKDIKQCGFKDSILLKYKPTPDFQQAYFHEKSGNYVMKYAAGQALVSAPFFAIGHFWASNSKVYPADGFSYPYQVSIGVGLFLLSLIGLYFLRKILLQYFKDSTVAILLLVYVLGTNYINYAAVDQAMTHSTLFTIYSILIWCTIRFYKYGRTSDAVFIGLLTGLATLIRPTEIISILLPVFWGISTIPELKERMALVLNQYQKFILAAALFIMVVAIQPLYWKYASGEWIVYSYGEQGFSWLHPHVYDHILSYRCGWLRFTPMMVLPFFGFWSFYKLQKNVLAVLGFIVLSFYLVTAWDVWDYGGTAGRAMVQYYPILAFPFCALIESTHTRRLYQYILYPGLVLLAYLNIWWVYNAHGGQVQVLELSRAYYRAKVGRWTADEEDKKLLDNKHVYRDQPKNTTVLFNNDFESDTSGHTIVKDGNRWLRMDKSHQYSPVFTIEHTKDIREWFRIKARFSCSNKEWDLWRQTQFIVKFYNGDKEVQSNMIRVYRFLNDGDTKEIYLDAKSPNAFTKLEVLFWHADSDKELLIDDLSISGFDE